VKKIKLGDKVKDTITDFEGIATIRSEYINGCVQFAVQPKGIKDGKMLEAEWVDEAQLVLVEDNNKKKTKPRQGGVRLHPKIR